MLYIPWRGLQSSCYMFCIVYNVKWRHLTCWAETKELLHVSKKGLFHVSCFMLPASFVRERIFPGQGSNTSPRLVTSALYPFCHWLLLLNCCYLVFYRLSVSRLMFHQWLKDIVDAFCSGGHEIVPSLGSLSVLAVPCPIS